MATKIRVYTYQSDTGPSGHVDETFVRGVGASGEAVFLDSAGNLTLPGTLDVAGILTAPEVEETVTGITAFATGGQASAVALTARWNNVTTCATAGDSVKLLTAVAGTVQTVKNSGATAMDVFPNTSDAINALAVNLAVRLPPGALVEFRAIDATTWETNELSAALSAALITAANVGTAGTNCTAAEYGDGYNHVTVLTLTAAELTPTIPADAEGAGAIIYTFPAGVYVGHSAHMDITAGVMDSATNAADVGLGSLISSGDIATLTTAAMEDWVTGQTIANVSTFVDETSTIMTAGAPLLFESGGSHVLNMNTAATWNNTVATASVTGTVTIHWTFLGA